MGGGRAGDLMSNTGRKRLIVMAAAILVAGTALVLVNIFGRPRIKGATSGDRIQSICRLADAKPFGAAVSAWGTRGEVSVLGVTRIQHGAEGRRER